MENREEAFHNVSVIKAISIQLTLKTVVLIKKDEASVWHGISHWFIHEKKT